MIDDVSERVAQDITERAVRLYGKKTSIANSSEAAYAYYSQDRGVRDRYKQDATRQLLEEAAERLRLYGEELGGPRPERDETPDPIEEAWTAGHAAAWRYVLGLALSHLGDGAPDAARLARERAAAVAALRRVCAAHGDLDWDTDLHLADIIEKHLERHLEKGGG